MSASTPELFWGLIDDAAVFPPGNAPLAVAIDRHRSHRAAAHSTCIGPLLIPAAAVAEAATLATSTVQVGIIGRPGTDPTVVASALEQVQSAPHLELAGVEVGWSADWIDLDVPSGVPLALEVPRGDLHDVALADLRSRNLAGDASAIAKFRTGPTPTWPWPDEAELADFIRTAVVLGVPFKLTGGLHHATRGTYSVRGVPEENHGLLNIILATSAALDRASTDELAALLRLQERRTLADLVGSLHESREIAVRGSFRSYGCCEVIDPISELVDLGLLPPSHLPKDLR